MSAPRRIPPGQKFGAARPRLCARSGPLPCRAPPRYLPLFVPAAFVPSVPAAPSAPPAFTPTPLPSHLPPPCSREERTRSPGAERAARRSSLRDAAGTGRGISAWGSSGPEPCARRQAAGLRERERRAVGGRAGGRAGSACSPAAPLRVGGTERCEVLISSVSRSELSVVTCSGEVPVGAKSSSDFSVSSYGAAPALLTAEGSPRFPLLSLFLPREPLAPAAVGAERCRRALRHVGTSGCCLARSVGQVQGLEGRIPRSHLNDENHRIVQIRRDR